MPTYEVIAWFVAAIIAGYLLGSIPTGVIVSRVAGGEDPRLKGSGKTGATNVLRTLGTGPATIVVLVDFCKGVAAVLLARFLFGALAHPGVSDATWNILRDSAEALASVAALLGHNYSVFIGFKGGRGVLTGAGAMTTMSPLATLFAACAGVPAIYLTRYVSLGSILGAFMGAVIEIFLVIIGHDSWPHGVFIVAAGIIVIISHRDNIQRLRAGVERKLGERASGATPAPDTAPQGSQD